MVGTVARVTGLINRLRTDRRLPPPTERLIVDLARGALIDGTQRIVASMRPATGRGNSVARLGWRRLRVDSALPTSLQDLGHQNAGQVIEALRGAGLDPFVTAQRGSSLQLALPHSARRQAWRALLSTLSDEPWYVDWTIGHRRRITALGRRQTRRARGARTWRLFRAYASGAEVIGHTASVELTFWQLGTSGEHERIGVRANSRYDDRSPTTTMEIDGHVYPGRSAFPVDVALEQLREPVDVVVTWVNGSDPDWHGNLVDWARREGRELSEEALDPARFHTRDELRYVLRSVWTYCGWVRRIFLVTADQRPQWLANGKGVTVVPHSDILPADALPTFNSHAIEAALHHIPGLADRFVYFNDDMFVARDVAPEFFFTPSGLPRVFASPARVPGYETSDTQAVDTGSLRGRELLLDRFARAATFKSHHSPYPLSTSISAEMEKEFPDAISRTQRSRFRSPADVSTASAFSQHYALATGRAVLSDLETDYFNTESPRLAWHLRRLRVCDRFDTFCINDTARPSNSTRADNEVEQFLAARFPTPAPWEAP